MKLRMVTARTGAALLWGAILFAGTGSANGVSWKAKQPPQFIVSGLLVHQADPSRQKLFHAVVPAGTKAEAEGGFVRAAKREYPDFAVTNTMATPVPPTSKCEIDI